MQQNYAPLITKPDHRLWLATYRSDSFASADDGSQYPKMHRPDQWKLWTSTKMVESHSNRVAAVDSTRNLLRGER